MPKSSLASRLRLGYIVFGVLIGLKVIEYLIANVIRQNAWPYLLILALVGAWAVLYYFMHINQLSHPKE